jgi:hypothetical protein
MRTKRLAIWTLGLAAALSISASASRAAIIPVVEYNFTTGQLVLDTNGADINSFGIGIPNQSHIVSVVADPDGAAGATWFTYYSAGMQMWESMVFSSAGNLVQGTWLLAELTPDLDQSAFTSSVFFNHLGVDVWTEVAIVPEPAAFGLIGLAGMGLLRRRRLG